MVQAVFLNIYKWAAQFTVIYSNVINALIITNSFNLIRMEG